MCFFKTGSLMMEITDQLNHIYQGTEDSAVGPKSHKHMTTMAKRRLQGSFTAINSPWWKGPVGAEVEVAMVTTAEGRAFPEEVRDLRPPLCPTVWPPLLLFLFFTSTTTFPVSVVKASLELPTERVDDTSWKLALVKRAAPSSSRFCEEAGRAGTTPPEPLLL